MVQFSGLCSKVIIATIGFIAPGCHAPYHIAFGCLNGCLYARIVPEISIGKYSTD